MKYLLKGMESQERITLLVSLTNIRSPQILKAISLHFVTGISITRASARVGVDFSNLHRAIESLNKR